jgi:mannose-6-phosphate isomerase-like protein (cupin superfamily)
MNILKENEGFAHGSSHVIMSMSHRNLCLTESGSVFGFVAEGVVAINEKRTIEALDYFCSEVNRFSSFEAKGTAFVVVAVGYKGYPFLQGKVALNKGFLNYIDGCTDSLLVPPVRKGQHPCLNMLYFPIEINQSWHTHSSFRAGLVVRGQGIACYEQEGQQLEKPLLEGDVFYLAPNELHRFRTEDKSMVICAFHPDSPQWGPEDECHPMITMTELVKKD